MTRLPLRFLPLVIGALCWLALLLTVLIREASSASVGLCLAWLAASTAILGAIVLKPSPVLATTASVLLLLLALLLVGEFGLFFLPAAVAGLVTAPLLNRGP